MRFTKRLGTTVAAITVGAGAVLSAGLVAGAQAGGQQHRQSVVRIADSGTTSTSTNPTATPTSGNDPWD